jgi:hypothetical protein
VLLLVVQLLLALLLRQWWWRRLLPLWLSTAIAIYFRHFSDQFFSQVSAREQQWHRQANQF